MPVVNGKLYFNTMAHYYISFELNGKEHYCTGESSYPSEYLVRTNTVDYGILEENVYDFIKTYMNLHSLCGRVNPKTVVFRYEL